MTMPAFTIPPTRAGTTQAVTDHNNIVLTLQALVAAQGTSSNPTPSPTPGLGPDKFGCWDSSINTCLADGQPALLPAGILPVRRPVIKPPGGIVRAAGGNEVATYLDALYGTVLQPTASWAKGDCPANAVVACLGQGDGSYPATSEEQKSYGYMIDCHLLPGTGATANTDGVQLYGGVGRTHWERVLVANAPRYAWNMSAVSASDGSSPGSYRLERCDARYAGSDGFLVSKTSDCTLRDCLAENCAGNGFTIVNLSNGILYACRAEHNGTSGVGDGFAYSCTNSSTGSGTGMFVACSTDRNEGNGISVTSPNNSGVPVHLVGCRFRRDGANGGAGGSSLAGVYITAYPSAVIMSGTVIFPGVDDSGSGANSPDIGLRIHSNSGSGYVIGAASWFHGNSQGKADDGTSAAATFAACYKAFGTTGAPTVSVA